MSEEKTIQRLETLGGSLAVLSWKASLACKRVWMENPKPADRTPEDECRVFEAFIRREQAITDLENAIADLQDAYISGCIRRIGQ